jgi:hypothetical protein
MGSFLAPVSIGRIGTNSGIDVPCSMSGVMRQCRPAGHLDDARGVTPPLLRNVDTLAWEQPQLFSTGSRRILATAHIAEAMGVPTEVRRHRPRTSGCLTRHSIAKTVWKEGTAILLVFAVLGLYGVVACAVSASCRATR